jgi:hypothetical protein
MLPGGAGVAVQKNGGVPRPLSKHRLFIIGIFVFSLIAHLPYLWPGGPCAYHPRTVFPSIDEGTVLYDSFRISCGEVMYRDFFEFQGPVFYHLYAGLFAITGPSMVAARALNLLTVALSAVFIALLIARILGTAAGATAATVHICLLVPMWPYAYPHWLAETFALAAIYLLVTGYMRPRYELAGGICLGLCSATIQSLGLPILGACMVALALPGIAQRNWRETYTRPLRVVLGASISIAPFIIYLGIAGALDQMWYSMGEWVIKHYPEGQKDAQGYGAYVDSFIALHRTVDQPWRGLATIGLQFVKFLPIFTICAMVVATVRLILNRWQRSVDYVHLLIALAVLVGIAPLFLGITRADTAHIAFVGSFGLCGAAIAFQPLVTWNPRLRLAVAIVWVFFGVLFIANFSAKTIMTYQPSREMKSWSGEILKLGIANWIDTKVGPDERIVTAAYGGLQYLYIRRAAVSFTFLPFNTPKYYSDEQWRKLGSEILQVLPPVVEVTEEQWQQITQRTPELKGMYRLVDNHFLMREGFTPLK